MSIKIPMIPHAIETAISRLVAQCLPHAAYCNCIQQHVKDEMSANKVAIYDCKDNIFITFSLA
jgi:hypothetical protein